MLNTTRATCQYGPARMKRGTMSPHGLKVRIEAEMVDKSKGSARAEVAGVERVQRSGARSSASRMRIFSVRVRLFLQT